MSKITFKQVLKLLYQARAGRVTQENLGRFLLNPDICPGYTVSQDYTVTVDYGKTVEEMVASGRYTIVNGNIIKHKFPIKENGMVQVTTVLVHFNLRMNTKDLLCYLNEGNLRPANSAEFLGFGTTFPEVELEFPIVCLDPCQEVPMIGQRVLTLSAYGPLDRVLDLRNFNCDKWEEYCQFLAVRK